MCNIVKERFSNEKYNKLISALKGRCDNYKYKIKFSHLAIFVELLPVKKYIISFCCHHQNQNNIWVTHKNFFTIFSRIETFIQTWKIRLFKIQSVSPRSGKKNYIQVRKQCDHEYPCRVHYLVTQNRQTSQDTGHVYRSRDKFVYLFL